MDRDIVIRVLAEGKDPSATRVSERAIATTRRARGSARRMPTGREDIPQAEVQPGRQQGRRRLDASPEARHPEEREGREGRPG